MDLKGKCVLLGVSGGIAAYKMANVASALRKLGADVEVIMTKNATQFITPITFETLTGHKCMVDTFDRDFKFEVTHISLAKKADVILVAPATANIIAKMAHGIADDMLTTVVLAAKCPKLVSPAMNTGCWRTPSPRTTSPHWKSTASRSSPPRAAYWPARTWAADACRKRMSCWTTSSAPSQSRRTSPVCALPSRPAPLRSRWTCALPDQPLHRQDGLCCGPCRRDAGSEVTLIHGPTALQPVRFTEDVPITTAQQMYEP